MLFTLRPTFPFFTNEKKNVINWKNSFSSSHCLGCSFANTSFYVVGCCVFLAIKKKEKTRKKTIGREKCLPSRKWGWKKNSHNENRSRYVKKRQKKSFVLPQTSRQPKGRISSEEKYTWNFILLITQFKFGKGKKKFFLFFREVSLLFFCSKINVSKHGFNWRKKLWSSHPSFFLVWRESKKEISPSKVSFVSSCKIV